MPTTPHSRFRVLLKWALSIAGIGILLYVGYFYYSLATGGDRMTEVCRQMKPGMPVDQLIALASEHGLGPSMPKPDTKLTYFAELRSFGRHACRVELENGVVKSATYNYAD
ncbi:MAG: hypothetical protein PHV02_00115 [Rhodocyclaceae bacterium]|nr:hypothetical protein [Rhodocyclaceae bacterium]